MAPYAPPDHDDQDDPLRREDAARRARAEQTLWSALGTLFRWRWFITGVTAGMAVLAVVLTLLMPNWYRASARLLLPAQGASGLSSALLGNLSTVARGFLGGQVGDYTRYIAILTSRTMYEAAVDSFDLITVYETEGKLSPRESAVAALDGNVEFTVDDKYEFLSIEVLDKDPQRAAAMANFFVRNLNRLNAQLSSQTASHFRAYVERRYQESEMALDSVLTGMERFQEQYHIYDLTTQAEAFFTQMAELRAGMIQAEIQYEAMRDQYGPENPQVQALREAVRAGTRKYQNLLAGQEAVFPIPQGTVPGVVRQYANLERERLIQGRILEVVAPLLEEARFEERRKIEAVQVVDTAVPPVKKAAPRRSLIVIGATLSAFLLAVLFALVYSWWTRNQAYLLRRLRTEAGDPRSEPNAEYPARQIA
jgi:tyrosine-protein kinase Etk/Wzc